jgi:two-component system cell cycle response regulator CtrA
MSGMETNYETWPKDRLVAKIFDLEATIESLKTFNADGMVLTVKEKFKLTLSEARLLTALADGKPHYKRGLYEFVYQDEFNNPPEMKIIDVFICKIRKKVFPFGIKIETIHSAGYRMVDPALFSRVIDGKIEPLVTEEYASAHRKKGENEKAVLNVLISEMDSAGKTKILARTLARKAGLAIPLLPIMTKLSEKGIIQVKSQPTRSNKLAPWVVHVKARAL